MEFQPLFLQKKPTEPEYIHNFVNEKKAPFEHLRFPMGIMTDKIRII